MSLLRRLEDALEKAIDGGLARVTGGGVHPLEIARRLQTEMADGKLLGTEIPWAPNRFTVRLADRDLDSLGDVAGEVAAQIARHLEEYAAEQGWAIGEGVVVRLEGGGTPGRLEVERGFEEAAPGAWLVVEAGQAGGGRFEVAERALIGRDPDCEVRLSEPTVSRRHAELRWTYAGYVLRDLGSSNGTFINGIEIADEAPVEDGDLIEAGLVQLRFRRRER